MPVRPSTLTSTSTASTRGGRSWSQRLQERYRFRLPVDLIDWFDGGVWQELGNSEFNQAVSPDMLLSDSPEVIWPGLMLPDALPLVGNRYGDWLCLRVGASDTVAEVVHWYHGGGDWIPWGKSLAEAIFFDTVRDLLPGVRASHAIPAEPRRRGTGNDRVFHWACDWLPSSVNVLLSDFSELWQDVPEKSGSRPSQSVSDEHRQLFAKRLLTLPVCEVAVRCELALQSLDSSVQQHLSPKLASELGIDWEPTAVSWLFDNSLIDQRAMSALQGAVSQPFGDLAQNWQRAIEMVQPICEKREDLGWAFDLCGWYAEQSGRLQEAIGYYSRGAMALAFADQSIRFRTHWFPQGYGKFSLWRLQQLVEDNTWLTADVRDWLAEFKKPEEQGLRARVSAYWQQKGSLAQEQQDWQRAFAAFYRSGWDLGLDHMSDFRHCLRGLCEVAHSSGDSARAAVASTHYESFLNRFG